MPTIHTLIEPERGCGFRKAGGRYLIGGTLSSPCCQLPFPLDPCPCCGNKIKFTRGFQWITTKLFSGFTALSNKCYSCIISERDERIGLMWVGEKYYPTPKDFIREANKIGVSKRIGTVPKDCKPGTWVALAHKKAICTETMNRLFNASKITFDYSPGIFMLFKITSIDYVVIGTETEEELTKLESEGFRLVRVEREGTQHALNFE